MFSRAARRAPLNLAVNLERTLARPPGIPLITKASFSIISYRLNNEKINSPDLSLEKNEREENAALPWYLRNETSSSLSSQIKHEQIPDIPNNAPESLKIVLEYLVRDLGLINVTLIDMRNTEDTPGSSQYTTGDFVILTTGKSERHLQKAGFELYTWTKHKFNVVPFMEGLVKAAAIRLSQRRLKKKARKMQNDFDAELNEVLPLNSWIMMDLRKDNIFIHLFTADRRVDLNLEELWGYENPELQQEEQNHNEYELDEKFSDSSELSDEIENSGEHSGEPSTSGIFNNSSQNRWYSTISTAFQSSNNYSSTQSPLNTNVSSKFTNSLKIASLNGDFKEAVKIASYIPKSIKINGEDSTSLVLKSHINCLRSINPSDHRMINNLLSGTNEVQKPLVNSFMSSLPVLMSPIHWRLKYLFLETAHLLSFEKFPLEMIIRHFIFQQSSGVSVDNSDFERFTTLLSHSHQFNSKGENKLMLNSSNEKQSIGKNLIANTFTKKEILMDFINMVWRTKGVKVLHDEKITLSLLYAFTTRNDKEAWKLEEVLAHPEPKFQGNNPIIIQSLPVAKDFTEILNAYSQNNPISFKMAIIFLTSYAQALNWNKYWEYWERGLAPVKSSNKYITVISESQLNFLWILNASLISKSGDQVAAHSFLLKQWPQYSIFASKSLEKNGLSENMKKAMKSILKVADANADIQTDLQRYLK